MADRRDDCRRFHGDLYCEVDRVDRFDRFDYDVSYFPYYYVQFYYPYSTAAGVIGTVPVTGTIVSTNSESTKAKNGAPNRGVPLLLQGPAPERPAEIPQLSDAGNPNEPPEPPAIWVVWRSFKNHNKTFKKRKHAQNFTREALQS